MIPILTLSYFSTGLVEKLHPPNYIVHLIIISEGGPLPWTLLCCFGIAGPLGLWRFLAAPPWAFGGAVGLVTNGYLEGWILGHQLGRLDVWMRVVGYMTWMTWYIIAIFLFVYIWYIYIYLYISMCSIYVYEYAVYIYSRLYYGMQLELKWLFGGSLLACNVQGFYSFPTNKNNGHQRLPGSEKNIHRELPHAVDLMLFGTMHRFVSAAHWYTASLKFTNHKSDEYHECHEVMFLHSWHSLSPMKFKRNNQQI